MSLESELYDRLSGHSGLSALVGTRIYPNLAPQGPVIPYVTYFRVDGVRTNKMGVKSPVVAARYQFDAWAREHRTVGGVTGARDVAEQLVAALDRWTNASGTVVQDTLIETDQDLFEEEPEPGLHRVILEAVIYYEE